ncbi:MAG: hypothetical protein QHC90_25610 [Shinella sp.]|nr:hypothetical protein [Shinella sp.]
MFETGVFVSAFIWLASTIWLGISLLRIPFRRWRSGGIRQAKLAGVLFVLSIAGVIVCNQFVYRDYGLPSREGLDEARAARKAERLARSAEEKALREAEEVRAGAQAEKDAAEAAALAQKEREETERKRKAEALEQAKSEAAERAEEAAKKCSDKTMAFVMSQEFVKRNLKAPSTAEFPWYTDDQVRVSTMQDCAFRVVGYVDAQNGFGAQIRSRYLVDLKYIDAEGTWQMTDIAIE